MIDSIRSGSWFRFALGALVFAAAACGSGGGGDDGAAGSDANGGGNGSCGAIVGSCLQSAHQACSELSAPSSAAEAQPACEHDGNTWSASPCNRTGSVGGCRYAPALAQAGCTTSWFFAPITASDAMAACAASHGTPLAP